jgi:hypothetical protein
MHPLLHPCLLSSCGQDAKRQSGRAAVLSSLLSSAWACMMVCGRFYILSDASVGVLDFCLRTLRHADPHTIPLCVCNSATGEIVEQSTWASYWAADERFNRTLVCDGGGCRGHTCAHTHAHTHTHTLRMPSGATPAMISSPPAHHVLGGTDESCLLSPVS